MMTADDAVRVVRAVGACPVQLAAAREALRRSPRPDHQMIAREMHVPEPPQPSQAVRRQTSDAHDDDGMPPGWWILPALGVASVALVFGAFPLLEKIVHRAFGLG